MSCRLCGNLWWDMLFQGRLEQEPRVVVLFDQSKAKHVTVGDEMKRKCQHVPLQGLYASFLMLLSCYSMLPGSL
jgi:hypothetical protein